MSILWWWGALAVANDTRVFAWGAANYNSEIGPVALADRTWAQPLPNLIGEVVSVDVSLGDWDHGVAARVDGSVVTWGNNAWGQGGIGAQSGSGWSGDLLPIPRVVPKLEGVVQVVAGGHHDLALDDQGRVWAWGGNALGQIGTGALSTAETSPFLVPLPLPAIAIGATYSASAAVLDDGTVWTWGSDGDQELGDGLLATASARPYPKPTAAMPARAVAVSGGMDHFLALLEDGTAQGWGGNWNAELCHPGLPVTVNGWSAGPVEVQDDWLNPLRDVVEVSAGDEFSLFRQASGEVWGCGRNDAGQLPDVFGTPAGMNVRLYALHGVVDVDAGGAHGLARNADGTVVTWGACSYGSCGTGTGLTDPSHVVTHPEVVKHVDGALALAAGGGSLALASAPGTRLYGTGGNAFGAVGDGGYTDLDVPVPIGFFNAWGGVVGVAGGYAHTLAVTGTGNVFAWGDNRLGELGDGTYNKSPWPVMVPDLDNVEQVAAGTELSLALKADGTLWAWGSNWDGCLGDGNRTGDSPAPVQVPLEGVVAVAAGHYHVLALTEDGRAWAWGGVGYEELGYPWSGWVSTPTEVLVDDVVGVSAGWGHSVVLTALGEVYTFGFNDVGQLGRGSVDPWPTTAWPPERVELDLATDVAAGGWLTMATLWDYSVMRWGDDITNPRWAMCFPDSGRGVASPVPVGALPPALDVAGGMCHGIVLGEDEHVWGFGSNQAGSLGDGTWTDTMVPTQMKLERIEAIGPAGPQTEVIARDPKGPVCVPPDPRCW